MNKSVASAQHSLFCKCLLTCLLSNKYHLFGNSLWVLVTSSQLIFIIRFRMNYFTCMKIWHICYFFPLLPLLSSRRTKYEIIFFGNVHPFIWSSAFLFFHCHQCTTRIYYATRTIKNEKTNLDSPFDNRPLS